jgi:hypothetical protein
MLPFGTYSIALLLNAYVSSTSINLYYAIARFHALICRAVFFNLFMTSTKSTLSIVWLAVCQIMIQCTAIWWRVKFVNQCFSC